MATSAACRLPDTVWINLQHAVKYQACVNTRSAADASIRNTSLLKQEQHAQPLRLSAAKAMLIKGYTAMALMHGLLTFSAASAPAVCAVEFQHQRCSSEALTGQLHPHHPAAACAAWCRCTPLRLLAALLLRHVLCCCAFAAACEPPQHLQTGTCNKAVNVGHHNPCLVAPKAMADFQSSCNTSSNTSGGNHHVMQTTTFCKAVLVGRRLSTIAHAPPFLHC
jgi:hypothetical protein